ncbi:MAG: glycosyltransferase family 4 protein [Candidatus Nealsonbacteria bacterium]
MKVLMPVLHYWPVIGGLETWTKNIAERTSNKAEVFAVTGKVKSQPEKENLNQVNIFRTSLFSLTNLSYSSFLYIITALPFIFFKSLSVMKKEKINIIHSQGFLSGFLGYLLSKLTKIPYIVTVQRLEQSKSFLRRLVYNNAKVCIAASSKIREYFESINCKNIMVIPNGVDLKRFQNLNRETNRKRLGLKNEFTIITVARLEKVKGIKYLIKALVLLNDKFQSSNVKYKLLIVGDGSERKNLENLTEKLNLQDKIRFLGQIPNEKIPEYLSVADCFVLPSLREGFGIVVLEAMASKLPVIATKIGGLLDLIENEKTGILVQPKNPEQISKALFKLYSQPEMNQQLVDRAFLNLDRYNWENIIERVYKIYEKHV